MWGTSWPRGATQGGSANGGAFNAPRLARGGDDKPVVFISYSRKDSLDFADQLFAALQACGYDPTIDRHGIYGAQDWQKRLEEMISGAETIIFVLSPESAISQACKWELDKALELSVVLALNGVAVTDRKKLRDDLQNAPAKTPLVFTILRDGAKMDIAITPRD